MSSGKLFIIVGGILGGLFGLFILTVMALGIMVGISRTNDTTKEVKVVSGQVTDLNKAVGEHLFPAVGQLQRDVADHGHRLDQIDSGYRSNGTPLSSTPVPSMSGPGSPSASAAARVASPEIQQWINQTQQMQTAQMEAMTRMVESLNKMKSDIEQLQKSAPQGMTLPQAAPMPTTSLPMPPSPSAPPLVRNASWGGVGPDQWFETENAALVSYKAAWDRKLEMDRTWVLNVLSNWRWWYDQQSSYTKQAYAGWNQAYTTQGPRLLDYIKDQQNAVNSEFRFKKDNLRNGYQIARSY